MSTSSRTGISEAVSPHSTSLINPTVPLRERLVDELTYLPC